jgi:hypothetical protein
MFKTSQQKGWMAGIATGVLTAGLMLGCDHTRPERLNAPPQGQTDQPSQLQEHFVPMVDNALLSEMSMSSVHFVPNSPELNALGVRRLTRYAEILDVYGGTLKYDGTDPDRELRQSRVHRIEEFLLACGLGVGEFDVEEGLAGGTGMDATEASDVRTATRGPGDVEISTADMELDQVGSSGGGGR